MNVIEVTDLMRSFPCIGGWNDALVGINLQVAPGEVVGLLGRNGAGKTTLIELLMGLYPADTGQVRLFGLDPREAPVEVKRRIGYVPDKLLLPESMSFERVIAFHRELFATWDEEFANQVIEDFGLKVNQRLGDMSKGQAQQAALVCAVSHKPELLLLDEPAAGLDPAARREFLEVTIRLLHEQETTILFSSHHMNDVERLAERVVMLDGGQVLLDDSIDRLKEEFSLALVTKDAGVSQENLMDLEGCIRAREQNGVLRAVFSRNSEKALDLLQPHLESDSVRCEALPLEELFVELVGGRS
ncbi:MAG: ABC-2 type transport system ATP-binding protein [Planctomycetota bacterium]|jgi:ABC-2 type transport system ATP-binding protein